MIPTKIFDGRAAAQEIKEDLKNEASKLGVKSNLAIVLVGDDQNSLSYVKQKQKACQDLAFGFYLYQRTEKTTFKQIEKLIQNLNHNREIHGLVLQLPLPAQLSAGQALGLINPQKDIDGLNPLSPFTPPTAQAVLHVLLKEKIEINGTRVTLLGRGRTAGKPIAQILKKRGAVVRVVHSKTPISDIRNQISKADIIVSAVGRANLITGPMIKEGAIVIGVGLSQPPTTNYQPPTIRGDLDEASLMGRASLITPTPGGIGPLTVAFLLKNLLKAARLSAARLPLKSKR